MSVLLCDAVARGLIQRLSGPDSVKPAPPEDGSKSRVEKALKRTSSSHGSFLDPVTLKEVHKAQEVRESSSREVMRCNHHQSGNF